MARAADTSVSQALSTIGIATQAAQVRVATVYAACMPTLLSGIDAGRQYSARVSAGSRGKHCRHSSYNSHAHG